jgi:flagellar export protein FliJ
MPFRFPLDPLLRVRQGQERQRELLLQEANFRVSALRQQIEDTHRGIEAIRACRQMQLTASASELHFDELCRSVLLDQARQLAKELAEAELLQQSRLADFQRARQRREVVETLRHQQAEIYHQEEARRQQRQLDELFLVQSWYRRG